MNKYIFGGLGLVLALLFLAILTLPDNNFHLIACDVGQGDAILAVYKTTEILIDGGPSGSRVLDCLTKYLPFWDREIEMVILTHPEIDHFGGLIEVFKRYQVDNYLANPIETGNQEYQVLQKLVGGSGARMVTPREGMLLKAGLMQFVILNPTNKISAQEIVKKGEVNSRSIVGILSVGSFDALLTGDITPEAISDMLAGNYIRPVEYIKIPHHGSRDGLTAGMLEAFVPKIAVISLKKGNSYGHPHEETLKILTDRNIRIFRTDELGNIELASDGQEWWIN
jgi:competence protein ComEC